MTPAQYARLTVRESRGARRRLALFTACLAVGVAAIVTVASLSASIDQGIRAEARRLLAADVTVSARRPLPATLDELLERAELATPGVIRRTSVRELVTVAAAPPQDGRPGPSRLVELKVIDGDFPFYGELKMEPAASLDALLAPGAVVVAPELLASLKIGVGDELLFGGAGYRIAGTVLDEPDRLNFSFSMGPRVFVSSEGLARASLLGRGSRVRYEALLKLPDGAGAADAHALEAFLKSQMPDAERYRITTYMDAQPSLRRSLARVARYLGLVGLLSLLIGGVGVAQTVRAWIAERTDAIAIMRCLGMRPREVVTLYAGQTVLLGLVGSALGAAIGIGIQVLVPTVILPEVVPPEFVRPWQPLAIVRGVALGVGVALIFSLPPLLDIRRVPPARVFRVDSEPLRLRRGTRFAATAVLLLGVWGAATWQGGSAAIGAIFTGGLVVVAALLAGGALGLSTLVARLPRDRGRLWLRHGLARLARPGAATVSSIVALGLGVMIVLAMHLVERHLTTQLAAELPEHSPSCFLVDIQPDQWEEVHRTLVENDARAIEVVPLVMARIRALDGVAADALLERGAPSEVGRDGGGEDDPGPSRWALRREQRLTYYETLPDGNEIVAGALWSDPALDEISIEEDFAESLGIGLGSTITLDVQGVAIELTVTSIRAVNWRTFGVNFFLVVEPGVLEDAPQMRIATALLPPGGDQRVQDALALAFPNITLIRIRDVLDKLLAMLNKASLGVQLLGGFTVIAGVIILAGSIGAGAVRRGREVALLKTLGMTRRGISAVFAVEYALVGLVAALVGGAAGAVLAWAVLTELMEIPWEHRPLAYAGTAAGTILLVVIAGLSASARALAVRPVAVLRAD